MATRSDIAKMIAAKSAAQNTKHSGTAKFTAAQAIVMSDHDLIEIAMSLGGLVT